MYITASGMYNRFMSSISVAEARKRLAGVITRARSEAVFIENRGQRAAVVVSPEQY